MGAFYLLIWRKLFMKWYANEKMMKAIKKMDLNLSDQNKASDNEKKSTDEKLEEMKVQNEVQEVLEEIEAVEPEETVETISATVEEKNEPSIIESKTTINGNIECEEDLTIKGEINGDVYVTGSVISSGKVVGKMTAANVTLLEAKHQGDINCSGELSLEYESSVLIGNVTADSCVIKGKVKGNIEVTEKCSLGEHAVVLGDIQAGSIEIEAGAVLKGQLVITKDAVIE